MHAAEDVKVYLVGNKSELDDQREVTREQAIEFAKENSISQIFETSAKTGYNVEEVFTCVGKELYIQVKSENEKKKADGEEVIDKRDSGKIKKDIKLKKGNNETAGGTPGEEKKKNCC